MVLLCKQKALYVKACVIANGVTDSQGDTLYTEDIKKIFTSFNNQNNFEVYHNDIPITEVSLLENYISTADETLGTATIPRGSWNVVIRVDNPEIQEALLTNEFRGVSLNNRIASKCTNGLTGQVRYADIPDAECVIPLLISFVERGANGYGLQVMDYTAYIQKSDKTKGIGKMDFKEFLDGVKLLIKKAENTEEEKTATNKDDDVETPKKDEEVVEVEKSKTTDESTEEPVEVEKECEEEEAEIEKDDTTEELSLEDRVAALEEIIKELTANKTTDENKVEVEKEEEPDETKEASDDEEEPDDEDTPKITKSEKVITTTGSTIKNNNYYQISGRDPLTGKKIRNQSKIL